MVVEWVPTISTVILSDILQPLVDLLLRGVMRSLALPPQFQRSDRGVLPPRVARVVVSCLPFDELWFLLHVGVVQTGLTRWPAHTC